MRNGLTCLLSGLAGGAVVAIILLQNPRGFSEAVAQSASPGPQLTIPATPPGDSQYAKAFNASGLTPDEEVNVWVYEKCNRSVVNISTRMVSSTGLFLLRIESEGNGSGSVLDKQGHILTNYHVVEDARQATVTLYDGESYQAKVVGADVLNDVAVLKIDAPSEKLHPIEIGDSERLQVGHRVFTLGNPFGLERTLSTGIVASLNRTLEVQENWVIKSVIQIDASINPGSSGGPLLDTRGRLIGMNTAIASSTGQSAGVGFAIPITLIRRVVPELIEHGRIIRGDIGITHVTKADKGLRIARMVPNGPAERAGLRGPMVKQSQQGFITVWRMDRSAADVITKVDGHKVETAADFLGYLDGKKPGDVVVLTVLREGKEIEVSVTLGGEQTPPKRRKAPGTI